jgi:hypothetical protein
LKSNWDQQKISGHVRDVGELIKGKLLVAEQWFLRNKKQSDAHKMWPPWIEVALDCLSFYFSEAVEIV